MRYIVTVDLYKQDCETWEFDNLKDAKAKFDELKNVYAGIVSSHEVLLCVVIAS